MPQFLRTAIPRVYQFLKLSDEPHLLDVLHQVFVSKFISAMFTQSVPIEISRRILDIFFWEGKGESTLLRILHNVLYYTEDKAMEMNDCDLIVKYYCSSDFVRDAFNM